MTEEGVVAEAEVQPVSDMGDTPGGADGGASSGDDVSHETAGADDNNDGVESSDAGTPAEPAPDPFSRRFAQLAREQKKLRQERDEMKRVQQELDARKGTVSTYDDLQKLARDNPYEVMQKLGLDYEALSKQVLQDGEKDPQQEMLNEIQSLKAELESIKKAEEEKSAQAQQSKQEKARIEWIDEIKTFVDNSSDEGRYEIINAVGQEAYELIAEVQTAHYQDTQEVMPYDEAALMVENHLEEQFSTEAQKYLKSNKVKSKLESLFAPAKTEPVAGQADEEAEASEKTPPKTLTNTQVQRAPGDKPKKLSKQQSIDLLVGKYGSSLFRQE